MTGRSRSARSSAKVEARGEVPPKMLLVTSTTDYYSLRASLGRTGASGTADQPLPANVRMYDIAGGSHVYRSQGADLHVAARPPRLGPAVAGPAAAP